MTKFLKGSYIFLIVALCFMLAGCGGGGGGDSTGTTTALTSGGTNPYAGGWSGNWLTSSGQGGLVTLNIAANGVISGTMFNTTYNQSGPMTGTIDNAGNFSSTYQYPNDPVGTFNGKLSLSTSMANTVDCQYSGSIGGQQYLGVSALTSTTAPTTNNQYMGVWSGPFQISNGNTGTLNFSIDSGGSVAGSIYNASINKNATLNGRIDNNGVLYGNYQYPGSEAGAISGTFSYTGANTVQCVFKNTIGNYVYAGNSNLTR